MRHSHFNLLGIVFVCLICHSCKEFSSPALKDRNLKGHIKSYIEHNYDVDYINKEVIKHNELSRTEYFFNKDGILMLEILSSKDVEYSRKVTELRGDTAIVTEFREGRPESKKEYTIRDKEGRIKEAFSLDTTTNRKSLYKRYEYNDDGLIKLRVESDSSVVFYVYDDNNFLVALDVLSESGQRIFSPYKYENDENGNHIKTRVQLCEDCRINNIVEEYNDNGDVVFYNMNDWFEWKYKYTYDRHHNWITSLRKSDEDSFEYKEREITYY